MRSLKAIEALLSECASDLEAHAASASALGFRAVPYHANSAATVAKEAARLAKFTREQSEADEALNAKLSRDAAAFDLAGSAAAHYSFN